MVKATKKQAKNGKQPKRSTVRVTKSSVPLAVSSVSRAVRQPVQRMLSNGDIIVQHRELVGVLNGSLAFARAFQGPVNPGNGAVFPWLSGVSQAYESYLFDSLSFEYVPHAPATAAGIVYMTVDYDPRDAFPVGRQQFTITPGSVSTQVHKGAKFVARRSDLQKRKTYFVRSGANGTNGTSVGVPDLASLDTGNFFVGLEGTTIDQTNPLAVVGQIWVQYSVKLMTPQPTVPAVNTSVKSEYTAAVSSGTNRIKMSDRSSASIAGTVNSYVDNNLLSTWNAGQAPSVLQDVSALAIHGFNAYPVTATDLSKWPVWPKSRLLINAAATPTNYSLTVPYSAGGGTGLAGISMTVLDLASGQTVDVQNDFRADAAVSAVWDTALSIIPVPKALTTDLVALLSTVSAGRFSTLAARVVKNGGTSSAADPLGNSYLESFPSWITKTGGLLDIPAGSWLITCDIVGTGLAATAWTSDTGTDERSVSVASAAGTALLNVLECSASLPFTLDTAVTATTVTGCRFHIMPKSGLFDHLTSL
jgi:hypothetical protein